MDKSEEYIGRFVYAAVEGVGIVLRNERGHEIYMSDETLNNLVSYARRHLGWTAYAPTEPKEAGGADDE